MRAQAVGIVLALDMPHLPSYRETKDSKETEEENSLTWRELSGRGGGDVCVKGFGAQNEVAQGPHLDHHPQTGLGQWTWCWPL